MSRKKKTTGGNPANRAFKDATEVGREIQQWGEQRLQSNDSQQALIGAAVVAWVGSGDPGRLGLNQCLSACFQLQMILDTMGVESYIVPVTLRLLDPATQQEVARVGDDAPTLVSGVNGWTGHAVLYLPSHERMLDPTFGQAFSRSPAADRVPLMTRIVKTINGTVDQAPNAGNQWQVRTRGRIAHYQVLPSSANPMNQPEVVAALNTITSKLRQTLPEISTQIRRLIEN